MFGDWGGGKTSIMKMLEADLDPDRWPEGSPEQRTCEGVAVVYVDTWLFEGYDDAKAALLSSVLLALSEHKRFGTKVKEKALSLLKSVNWMRFTKLSLQHVAVPAAVALCTGGTAAIPAAVAASSGLFRLWPKQKQKESAEPDASTDDEGNEDEDDKDSAPDWGSILKEESEKDSIDVRSFRDRFKKMLDEVGIKSLVVLVDDLDRCTPERVVENLEAIKLFLSVPQSAFVIGADRRVVEHAIRSRYADRAAEGAGRDESTRLVKEYLEKLVQVPYSLPRLSATEVQTYMVLLFCKHHLMDADMQACMSSCESGRERNRYGSFGFGDVRDVLQKQGKEVDGALSRALTFAASTAHLIADGLKGNPRQVKRFLNALLLRMELARVAKLTTVREDVLVKLMILEYAHLDRFTELFGMQASSDGQPEKLKKLEAVLAGKSGDVADEEGAKQIDPNWAGTQVRRWVAMEPHLAGLDLRDYFWIARDRLESTFSGVAMIPPAVRAVFDDLLSSASPKRKAAVRSAAALRDDERAVLFALLDQHIVRQPGQKLGYDALRSLAEGGVTSAAETLATILINRPPDKVPPAVGMDVLTLLNAHPELSGILEPVQEHLSRSSTKVGAAVRDAKR